MRTIRAISLWQPWASAMAFGIKKNETRHWATDYRGPLAIHAAKTREYLDYYFKTRWQPDGIGAAVVSALAVAGIRAGEYPLGAVVGVTNVIDCVPVEKLPNLISTDPNEYFLGNYGGGRFAWLTDGMIPLTLPIPERGRQGFWNWQPPDDFELAYEDAIPVGKWVRP